MLNTYLCFWKRSNLKIVTWCRVSHSNVWTDCHPFELKMQTYTCRLLVLPNSQLTFSSHTYVCIFFTAMYVRTSPTASGTARWVICGHLKHLVRNIYPTSILCSGKVQPTPGPPSPNPYDQLESRNSRMKNRLRGVQNKKAATKYLFHLFVHTNTHIIQSH